MESYDGSATPLLQKTLSTDIITVYVTDFVRDVSIQSSILVTAGKKAYFNVDHVYASITLPSSLSLDLRQKNGSKLTFVTLTNDASSTDVEIDATYLLPIEYTLVLEAFESEGAFKGLSLKTDTVTILVTKALPNCQ